MASRKNILRCRPGKFKLSPVKDKVPCRSKERQGTVYPPTQAFAIERF